MSSPDGSEPPPPGENSKKIEWKTSAAKQHVLRLIEDGVIPLENEATKPGYLKPKQIFENFCMNDPSFQDFKDYKELKFSEKLKAIRKSVEKARSEKDTKQKGWTKSDAREHVEKLILDGKIPLAHKEEEGGAESSHLMPKEIFDKFCKPHPSFKDFTDYTKLNFSSNLRAIRLRIKLKYEKKKSDEEALAHDRLLHPRPVCDGYGLPRWKDSEACKILKVHLNDGLYPEHKPMFLWNSYADYRKYPLTKFRKHIHQEIKSQKWQDQYCAKEYYAEK